jgi:hypothetical protein
VIAMNKKQHREYHTYEISVSPITIYEPVTFEIPVNPITILTPAMCKGNIAPLKVKK